MKTLFAIFGFVCFTFLGSNAQNTMIQNGANNNTAYTVSEANALLASNQTNGTTERFTSTENLSTVAEQIQTARIKNNLSTSELAEKVGLTNEQVIKIEAGKSTPMRRIMVKFEMALDFTIIIDASENQKMSSK